MKRLVLIILALIFVLAGCGKTEEKKKIGEPIPGAESEGENVEEPPVPVELTQEECVELWPVVNDIQYNYFLRTSFTGETEAARVPKEGMFYGLYYGEGNIKKSHVAYGTKTGNVYDVYVQSADNGWIRVPDMMVSMRLEEDESWSFLSNKILWEQGCISGFPQQTVELSEFSAPAALCIYPPVLEGRLPAVQVVGQDGEAVVSYPEYRPDDFPAGEFGGVTGVTYEDADGDGNTDIIVKELYGETEVTLTYSGYDSGTLPPGRFFTLIKYETN
ncbi:MAG: hypothetical protein IJU50_04415 [Lachnospiraceae bacterium]|nr:hypothetical protein [Lachnospiraceae bacterium]